MNDGGPAFPSVDAVGYHYDGMSLRDYFAIHCDQPGQLEMAAEAGVLTQEYAGPDYDSEQRRKFPLWHAWFHSLPQNDRYALYAKVRYALADAMLKERERAT